MIFIWISQTQIFDTRKRYISFFFFFFFVTYNKKKSLLICEGYSVSLIFIGAVEYFEVSNIYQVISFMQTRKEDERKKIINYL